MQASIKQITKALKRNPKAKLFADINNELFEITDLQMGLLNSENRILFDADEFGERESNEVPHIGDTAWADVIGKATHHLIDDVELLVAVNQGNTHVINGHVSIVNDMVILHGEIDESLPQEGSTVITQVFKHKPSKVVFKKYDLNDVGEICIYIDSNNYGIRLENFTFFHNVPLSTPYIYEVEKHVADGYREGVFDTTTVEYHFDPMLALERAEALDKAPRNESEHEVKLTRLD